MATQRRFPFVKFTIAIGAPLLAALAGCQQSVMVVDALPSPNLNAPDIVRPAAPVAVIPPLAPLTPFASVTSRSIKGIPADWMPVAAARPWKWIVIHHSASPTGSAAVFDREHREKGWDELGYHFVIGNGTQSGDGQVEVGPRWPIQKHGAHAKTPDNRYNDFGVGICLVGNFDVQHPSPAQLRSVAKLCAFLQARYNIPSNCIVGHRDTKPTDCPGSNTNVAQIRRMAGEVLADAGIADPTGTDLAIAPTTQPTQSANAVELMTDSPSAN